MRLHAWPCTLFFGTKWPEMDVFFVFSLGVEGNSGGIGRVLR